MKYLPEPEHERGTISAAAVLLVNLGTPDAPTPAVDRLDQLNVPVLVIVGAHDTPYILAAADHMVEKIRTASKVVIDDAAHLPNMDHPGEFQRIVDRFLDGLPATS